MGYESIEAFLTSDRGVQWIAVAIGWMVDFSLRILLQVSLFWFGLTAFFREPEITNPIHLAILGLVLLSTAIGGFVAARVAERSEALHGMLVGLVGILAVAATSIGLQPTPLIFIVAQIVSVGTATLGGLLASRFRLH